MTDHSSISSAEAKDRARRNVWTLLAELEQLGEQGAEFSERDCLEALIARLVAFFQATAGAVWLLNRQNRLELRADVHLGEAMALGNADGERNGQWHARLLETSLSSGAPRIIPPSAADSDDGIVNRSPCTVMIAVIQVDGKTRGLLEVFVPREFDPEIQQGFLWMVEEAASVAGRHVSAAPKPQRTPNLQPPSSKAAAREQKFTGELVEFLRAVHGSLDLNATCLQIANESARLLACDRASVAIMRGGKCRLAAISGQSEFNRRANAVVLLEKLVSAAARVREPLWYDGETADLAPQLSTAIRDYANESFVKALAVLPLLRVETSGSPLTSTPAALPGAATAGREVSKAAGTRTITLGALVLEQIEEPAFPQQVRQRAPTLTAHSAVALANAQQHAGLFLLPVWRTLGRWWRYCAGTGRRLALFILAVAIIVAIGLAVIPADFTVEAPGSLQPVLQREVFAQEAGVVHALHARHGDIVRPEQLLAELRNVELDVKLTEVRGQFSSANEELQAVEASLLGGPERLDPTLRDQYLGRKRQLEESLANLHLQLELLQKRRELLRVTSPIAGRVTTLDMQQRLLHRPVERGQLLISVAETEGEWELKLQLPEDRLGHLQQARKAAGEKPLRVWFRVVNEPGAEFEGELAEVHERSELHEEHGQSVVLKAKIDKGRVGHLRQGASVVARVDCGRRALGYVWFHDVWEFVQTRVLFLI